MNNVDILKRRIDNLYKLTNMPDMVKEALIEELNEMVEDIKESLVSEKGEGVIKRQAEIRLLRNLVFLFEEGLLEVIQALEEQLKEFVSTPSEEEEGRHNKQRRNLWRIRKGK